jgi:GAF domain-containing protein
VAEGDVWGALNVEETAPDAFDHDDVILLSTLANQVSAALRAASLLECLEHAKALGRPVDVPGAGLTMLRDRRAAGRRELTGRGR